MADERVQKAPSRSTRHGRLWLAADLGDAWDLVADEVWRAESIDPFHSAHEAIAKIREEYLELEDEILNKKREETDWFARQTEAVHLAAVAIKFLMELCFQSEEDGGDGG